MARFLQSQCRVFDNRKALNRFLITERTIALAHIPAAACLVVGMLAVGNVVPLAAQCKWQLIFTSSMYLVMANSRNAYVNLQDYLIAIVHKREEPSKHARGEINQYNRDLLQVFAALTMALASYSLLNSSIIALLKAGNSRIELCLGQFALAFGLYLMGTAGNNAGTDRAKGVGCTRLLLGFQNVISSAAYSTTGLLLLLSPHASKESIAYQRALQLSATVGGIITMLSAVMHFFYTLASTRVQSENFMKCQRAKEVHRKMDSGFLKRGYFRRIIDAISSGGKSFLLSRVVCNDSTIEPLWLKYGFEGSKPDASRKSNLSGGRKSWSLSSSVSLTKSTSFVIRT